jgi:hypothetical protein
LPGLPAWALQCCNWAAGVVSAAWAAAHPSKASARLAKVNKERIGGMAGAF